MVENNSNNSSFLIEIDLNKSVRENAVDYFESAKNVRKKILGLSKVLENERNKSSKLDSVQGSKKSNLIVVQRKWFFDYRWFFTSDGFLVIGGKDAKSNEEIVKKKMLSEDLYFHADVFGAPHCVLKTNKKIVSQESKLEAAQFAGIFSKAWQDGLAFVDVYSVKPEQVSKKAPSGESIGKGAFMIYGEREWFRKVSLSCAIGFFKKENCLMCGPTSAIKKNCSVFFELVQANYSKEDCAKKLRELFSSKGLFFSLDDFVSILPTDKVFVK